MDICRVWGGSAPGAARQASWLFLFFVAFPLPAIPQQQDRWGLVVAIAAANLVTAVAVRRLPWDRWPESATSWLLVPVLATLTATAWSARELATLMGPFYVLVFAWLGLHQSPRFVALVAPVVAAAYGAALLGTGAPGEGYVAIVLLFPVGAVVGVVIARHVAELRAAQAQMLAEERWRAAIMATLAHDVRAPLTTIVGALEILEDDPHVSAHHAPLVAAATRQAQRITRLATGLLEVERVEQGKLRLDSHPVCLRELAQEVADAVDVSLVRVEVDPHLWVWADRERLEQILVNLTGNALRHGLPPVIIDAASTHAGVRVSVRDHGLGVPTAHVRDLFDRMHSSDESPQSVGLGLWIVRLLAEAHGGSVEYRPASPGSEFVVQLPRTPGESAVASPAPELRAAVV